MEKTRKPETSTPAKSAPPPLPATAEKELCPHHRISWKVTNGFQTRQTCLDCGFVRIGRPKSAPAPSRYSSSAEGDLPLSFTPQMAQAVFRMSSMMALIKHNETGENLTSEDLSGLLRGAMLSIVNWPPEDIVSQIPTHRQLFLRVLDPPAQVHHLLLLPLRLYQHQTEALPETVAMSRS